MNRLLATKTILLAILLTACGGGGNGPTPPAPHPDGGPAITPTHKPGQTDYVTEEPGQGGAGGSRGSADGGASSGTGGSGSGGSGSGAGGASAPGSAANPPGGRNATVEEGDIYRVDGNRLYYLNTYRGFVIYDLADPKQPRRISRLPVFGYPIEMFVSGNTIHALLRDALYLTQVGGEFQYERHNVSQLVTIDVSDPANPRVLSTRDIRGELREGVSRKIENTIYVVSYFPQSYYWGWRPEPGTAREQAWVYSFNVADPANPIKQGEHKIFEGGSINVYDQKTGASVNRSFSGVAISATSNALMVVENWWLSSSSGWNGNGCGQYSSGQQSVVSLIDISDPQGNIAEHARFETPGMLNDQFKMTYVHQPATATTPATGTFLGIFARQVWQSSGCTGEQFTQNTLESWDVSERGKPRRLATLDFGKPNETVRGSAFDVERKVAYAITAQRIDPLYALSFADRSNLKKLSEIDGLSGDMSVFRLVGGRNFLLAVGQDNSETCAGLQGSGGRTPTKIAASLIDVRDLANIRLVQRQCVAVEGGEWVGSGVSNNLDQAHKMLGMHADGDLNILTVPVYYYKKLETSRDWWGYRWETAVGLMTWDLRKYDETRTPATQQVFENFGTFVHPYGEVRRSIVFRHQAAGAPAPRRMMVNLSDTHVSIVDIEDMQKPQLQSTIELAPYYNQVYRFGDYLVEQVQSQPSWYWSASQELAQFRVKRAGGDLEGAPVLASFQFGQVQRVWKHGDSLVLFQQKGSYGYGPTGVYETPTTEVQVVDMRDPTMPRVAGRVSFPAPIFGYHYPFYCGVGAYWWGYWFDQPSNFAVTSSGIAFYVNSWYSPGAYQNALVFVDVRNPDAPAIRTQRLPDEASWNQYGMVADPVDSNGFYVSRRERLEPGTSAQGLPVERFRYYAQRWEPSADGTTWSAKADINIPGRLIRTWNSSAGQRMFLSQDFSYRPSGQEYAPWRADYNLTLMRQVTVAGKPAAEFLDARLLRDTYPGALQIDADKLVVSARPQNWSYGYDPNPPALTWRETSDRLMIFDLAGERLQLVHDQPTRMYGLQLMGNHQGKLFLNIGGGSNSYGSQGDGVLVVDLANPARPQATKFVRTLGQATHIEFFDDEAYIASGHFGLVHLDLKAGSDIAIE